MDLVSAARRLSKPFLFKSRADFASLPLGARGLIGDGFTAALVAADGAVDWLCLPRFDSPSVFARLLDAERGGCLAVRPSTTPFESLQQYDPDTNVLETLFTQPGKGTAHLVDFMPWANDPRASMLELHRRVDCSDGVVELEVVFDPRFNFGADVPRLEVQPNGLLAIGANGERLTLSVSRTLTWEPTPGGGLRGTVTLSQGAHLWTVLAWGASAVAPVDSHRPYEHLRVTRQRWRDWSAQLSYDGPWRHHVLRAALTLKMLMYAPTGAVVAAPTTSLPEWPGGPRNWDYRYSWTRDAAMAIRAANLIGFKAESRDFYHFIRDAVHHSGGLELMYTIDGLPVPEEHELTHLAGALNSKPVRVGNGARDQTQLDTVGALVDAANLFERFGGTLSLHAWDTLVGVLEVAERRWMEPDHGIWEPRNGKRHNVHSKLMNWLGMDRGAQLALSFGRQDLHDRWKAVAATIHADICEAGMDPTRQHFVSAYGETTPDATLLLLPIHGFLPPDDPRVVATVEWVQRELAGGTSLYRYKGDDGVGGAEGTFTLCGFWLAEALALMGRVSEALDVFRAHTEASNHLGLLSEELDPRDGSLLGNFPQAFSHLGLINAAARIDLALRLRDEGSARSPHLVGSKPRG